MSLLLSAAGKSTFLRLLEDSSLKYQVVSEPLTRWCSVPCDGEVGSGWKPATWVGVTNLVARIFKRYTSKCMQTLVGMVIIHWHYRVND